VPDPAPPITTTRVTPVYSSPWMRVEEHAVIHPDGRPGIYSIARYGDGITVLPVAEDTCYLIREYKYALDRRLLQLPSGGIDDDEQPLHAARRELLEETGLTAKTWTSLGLVHPYPTNMPSAVHLFIARGVRVAQSPEPGIELLALSHAEVRALIADNQVTHAASLVCLLTYLAAAPHQ
jgi:8-oxo-dGTP pyrophosphatase MutT (NUDIX family)